MTKHTSGPWYATDWGNIVTHDPTGRHEDIYIAEVCREDEEGRIVPLIEQQANIHLIAAAPDMLNALLDVLDFWDDPDMSMSELKERVRDAIAKAQGEG